MCSCLWPQTSRNLVQRKVRISGVYINNINNNKKSVLNYKAQQTQTSIRSSCGWRCLPLFPPSAPFSSEEDYGSEGKVCPGIDRIEISFWQGACKQEEEDADASCCCGQAPFVLGPAGFGTRSLVRPPAVRGVCCPLYPE